MNRTTKKNPASARKGDATPAASSFLQRMMNSMPLVQKVLVALFFVSVWAVLAFYESALLQRTESLSLFLYDSAFFENMTAVPAGLLSYVGCFLIQFFHYPAVGAALYVLLLFLVYYLTRKVFDIPAKCALLALVPVVAIIASNTQLGYWLFYLKMPGYYYMALLATVFSLSAMWAYKHLGVVWRLLLLAVWVAAGYPFMGVYALVAAVLMALMGLAIAIRDKSGIAMSAVTLVVTLLLVYFIPVVCYYMCYDTVAFELMHVAGVPVTQWSSRMVEGVKYENDSFWNCIHVYWFPLSLLLLSMLGGIVSFLLRGCSFVKDKVVTAVTCVTFLLSLAFMLRFWFCDANYRIENKQMVAMWNEDWEAVAEYAREVKKPTRQVVLNKNIALFNLGKAGNEAFTYPDGSLLPVSPIPIHMTHTDGSSLYYNYGKFNFSYRWCIENSVEYGWRVEYLKNAARSMLLSGEYKLAERYTRILKSTLFHREWACEMEKFIENPELISKEPSFHVPLQFACYSDALGVDEGVEVQLTSTLDALALQGNSNAALLSAMEKAFTDGDIEALNAAYAAKNTISPVYLESSMIMALVKKDSKRFWNLLQLYLDNHMKGVDVAKGQKIYKPLPQHYQEALMLFLTLDKGKTVQIDDNFLNMFVSRTHGGTEARFNDFQRDVAVGRDALKKRFPDITEARMNAVLAETLKEKHGNTYYYYYFFVKKIKTY